MITPFHSVKYNSSSKNLENQIRDFDKQFSSVREPVLLQKETV